MALTKEEKKAKKEAKKQEKLKALQEARKRLKYEELKREVAFQAKRKAELDKTWRDAMLKINEPVFKQQIEVLRNTFERVCDKKDFLINKIIGLMDVADDQYQRTVSSFCETLDTMILKFQTDLEDLSKENHKRTSELLQRGENEVDRIKSDHNVAEMHLQLLIYHADTTADNRVWTKRGENLVKEDEERTKYLDERENLVSLLEDIYSNTWDKYKAVLKAYVTDTVENQKQLRRLNRKENLMADIIASQGKKIANSDGILKRLKTELAAYESGTKQAVFRDRRNRHRKACSNLKKRLINGCNLDSKQLAILVRASDDAVEWLTYAYKKAEKILRLAALCRKMETLREKVLPFGSTQFNESNNLSVNIHQSGSNDSLVGNSIAATSGLTRLWHRISRAELVKRALTREKYLLEHENAMISQMLRERENEDMQPEAETCLCYKIPSKPSRPVAIEAVFEVSKIQMLEKNCSNIRQ